MAKLYNQDGDELPFQRGSKIEECAGCLIVLPFNKGGMHGVYRRARGRGYLLGALVAYTSSRESAREHASKYDAQLKRDKRARESAAAKLGRKILKQTKVITLEAHRG